MKGQAFLPGLSNTVSSAPHHYKVLVDGVVNPGVLERELAMLLVYPIIHYALSSLQLLFAFFPSESATRTLQLQ